MEEMNSTSNYAAMDSKKERHGFVTVWLWLGIIGNIIIIPLSILMYQKLTDIGSLVNADEAIQTHVIIMQIAAAVSGICMTIFYIQILKWKKCGFWGIVATGTITAIINIIMMSLILIDFCLTGLSLPYHPAIQVITTTLSLLILFGILQIKKNGISCWKQLESVHQEASSSGLSPKQNGDNKKKRMYLLILIAVLITAATSAIVVLISKVITPTEEVQYNERLYTSIYDLSIYGNDIYAVGSTSMGSSESDIPTLWINGQPQEIGNEGDFNHATSLFVDGNNVYVTINENGQNQALLWKNGDTKVLAEGDYAEANCVYVDNNNVYVVGQKDNQPTLWINGEPKILGEIGSATAVLVKDNKIYVAGYMGEFFSSESFLYMTNDNDDEMFFNIEMDKANSICLTNDGDIIVAGESKDKAALWKDDHLEILGDGSAESVAVNNANDIVVTGITFDANGRSTAAVWVNSGPTQMCKNILGYQSMAVATDGKVFYISGCSSDGKWAVYKYGTESAFNPNNLIRIP